MKRTPSQADEFLRAGGRIMEQTGFYGGARPCALAWVLTFAQDTLEKLGWGDRINRWQEVKRFAADGGVGDEAAFTNQVSVRVQLPDRLHSPYTDKRTEPGPGELDFLKTLQSAVLTDLRSYLRVGRTRMGGLTIDLTVTREPPAVAVHAANLHTGFFYQLFHLLGELGPRIKECRGCTRLFLAGRTDKEFCNRLCQAVVYKREHPKKRKQPKRR